MVGDCEFNGCHHCTPCERRVWIKIILQNKIESKHKRVLIHCRTFNLSAGNASSSYSTVEPPLTANSPQRPLLFVPADSANIDSCLRWLNTVLWAVSGNLRDGACFKLDKQTWRWKSIGTQKTISQNLLIEIFWYLAEFLPLSYFNNENFKMEVKQTNVVTYLIITVQSYYWLSKNPSVKIWSNKFQMVMINYSKLCASL